MIDLGNSVEDLGNIEVWYKDRGIEERQMKTGSDEFFIRQV